MLCNPSTFILIPHVNYELYNVQGWFAMPRVTECAAFECFGADIKEARKALGMSRRVLAEIINIDPRYLANIENSGSLPSLPVFYDLVKICKLPVNRYFCPEIKETFENAGRERMGLKLRLCPDKYLPIIEGALDTILGFHDKEKL